MRMMRGFSHVWLAIGLLLATSIVVEASVPPTVGIEGQLEAILPIAGLRAKPVDRTSPITLRIASAMPHGTAVRYDLRYIGAVPGQFDLRSYLLLENGSAAEGLPELPVKIAGVLPEEHDGSLSLPESGGTSVSANYRWVMAGAVAVWGLLGIPLFLTKRRRRQRATASLARPTTIEERLRPFVEAAAQGSLSIDQQARLERMLLGHWQERLELGGLNPADAMARLRADPKAGALLRALEDWLHRRPGTARVHVDELLAPYRTKEPEMAAAV